MTLASASLWLVAARSIICRPARSKWVHLLAGWPAEPKPSERAAKLARFRGRGASRLAAICMICRPDEQHPSVPGPWGWLRASPKGPPPKWGAIMRLARRSSGCASLAKKGLARWVVERRAGSMLGQ